MSRLPEAFLTAVLLGAVLGVFWEVKQAQARKDAVYACMAAQDDVTDSNVEERFAACEKIILHREMLGR